MNLRTRWELVLSVVVLGTLPLAAAANCAAPGAGASSGVRTYRGTAVPLGRGTAHTWVDTDAAGAPIRIGIALTEGALSGLPPTPADAPAFYTVEHVLPLPAEVSVPPFRHVVLNWNPKGHIPPHVYDVPHFDFHFYILTPEERAKVSIAGAGMALVQQKPPERYLPPGYIAAPGGEESGMGAHWVDLASHEFHGNPFTHAFIYGTYAGRIAFLEPMVANTFLEKKQNVDLPIAQPPAVQVKGYYPTRYFVRYDPARKEYQVGMDGMRLREATP